MKEKNAYTIFLSIVGGIAVMIALGAVSISENSGELLLVSLSVALIGLFPIRLPNRFYYTFDHIPKFYLAMVYDWKIAIIPSLISMIAVNVHDFSNFKRNSRKHIFRLFVSLGLFMFPLFVVYLGLHLTTITNPLLKVMLVAIAADLFSLSMNKSVQISILGWSVIRKPTLKSTLYPVLFILLSTILLYRLVQAESRSDLAMEIFFSCINIFIIFVISKSAVDHQIRAMELKEGFELSLTSVGQLFLLIDMKGMIANANSIMEQALGTTSTALNKQPLWDIVLEPNADLQNLFQAAAEGIPQKVSLSLIHANGHPVPLTASFVPHFQSKKVTGIYLVGRLTGEGIKR